MLTLENVIKARRELAFAGEKVTIRKVHAKLGHHGTEAEVSQFMKQINQGLYRDNTNFVVQIISSPKKLNEHR